MYTKEIFILIKWTIFNSTLGKKDFYPFLVSEYLKSRYGHAPTDDRQDYAHYGLVESWFQLETIGRVLNVTDTKMFRNQKKSRTDCFSIFDISLAWSHGRGDFTERDWNALVYGVYKVFSMNHFQLYISVDTHPQIQAWDSSPESANTRLYIWNSLETLLDKKPLWIILERCFRITGFEKSFDDHNQLWSWRNGFI